MSEVPPPYDRSFSFTDFSTYNPSLQQPGNKIDQELNNIQVSVNQTIDRLSEIQLDDGRLDSTSLNFNAILTGLSTQLSLTYAAINSPVFTGSPEAPTPNQYDASSKIATTSFVKNQNYATISDLASLQSSLSGYLTLGGGTLSGNLIVDAGEGSSGHFESTEVYVTRNDATGTEANAYGALYNGGLSVGDATGKYAELTPDHIRFGDGTTQTTAATAGVFLPLTGGEMTGELSMGGNQITNCTIGYIGQITFQNDSIQTTAYNPAILGNYLPLAGGTLTGNLIVNSGSGSYAQVDPSEIFTQQTNAGVGQTNAYGYLYNGGIEIGDTAGKWAELTTTHLRFGDGTTQTTAATAGAFLPLDGGIMSGAIRFDSVGTQNISKGSFDSGRGGYNGISLTCAVDYELNWQSGYLKALNSGGFVVPINVESNLVFIKNIDGVEEEISPYTRTTTISLDGGISFNGDNSNNDHNFTLNEFGVGGSFGGDDHWGLGVNGVQNGGNGNHDNWYLSANAVGRTDANGADPWSFGKDGAKFVDGTTQTTAYDPAVLDSYLPLAGGTLTGEIVNTTIPDIDNQGEKSTFGYNGLSAVYYTGAENTLLTTYGHSSIDHSVFDNPYNFHLNQNGVYGVGDDEVSWGVGINGVTYPDSSVQQTAFPGYSGTTSQYIRGDGSLVTFPTIPSIAGLLVASNNLSDLSNSTTARTNLGLGSMATQPASAYLSTAAAASTYQTQSGMSVYLSTSAASSTYLTQSNASSTYMTQSSAASTYIGTSAYATTAQAQAGTSTTTVVSPATFFDARWFAGGKSMVQIAWSNASSGVGAQTNSQNGNARLNVAPTTVIGYAVTSSVIANANRGTSYAAGIDFTKRVVAGLRVARNVASPDANSILRYSIGKTTGTANVGDLSVRGMMIKVSGGGALQFLVHNGTSLTTVTSSFTPVNNQAYDVVMISDGSGNATLYVNGSSVATTTGAPVLVGPGSQLTFECENIAIITGSPQNMCISDYYVQINL